MVYSCKNSSLLLCSGYEKAVKNYRFIVIKTIIKNGAHELRFYLNLKLKTIAGCIGNMRKLLSLNRRFSGRLQAIYSVVYSCKNSIASRFTDYEKDVKGYRFILIEL